MTEANYAEKIGAEKSAQTPGALLPSSHLDRDETIIAQARAWTGEFTYDRLRRESNERKALGAEAARIAALPALDRILEGKADATKWFSALFGKGADFLAPLKEQVLQALVNWRDSRTQAAANDPLLHPQPPGYVPTKRVTDRLIPLH